MVNMWSMDRRWGVNVERGGERGTAGKLSAVDSALFSRELGLDGAEEKLQ